MYMQKDSAIRIKKLTATAMFCALAYVCMYFVKIPVGFLTLDVKDSLIILCSLLFGPVYGLTIAVVVPLLERLLGGKKTVKTNLPTSGKAVLYKKDGAYVLHLLYANIVKRGEDVEVIEDLATIADISVSLDLPEKVSRAVCRPSGKELALTEKDGRVCFALDKLRCSEIVELS